VLDLLVGVRRMERDEVNELERIVRAARVRQRIVSAFARMYDVPKRDVEHLMARAIDLSRGAGRVPSCVRSDDFASAYREQTRYAIGRIITYMRDNFGK